MNSDEDNGSLHYTFKRRIQSAPNGESVYAVMTLHLETTTGQGSSN